MMGLLSLHVYHTPMLMAAVAVEVAAVEVIVTETVYKNQNDKAPHKVALIVHLLYRDMRWY